MSLYAWPNDLPGQAITLETLALKENTMTIQRIETGPRMSQAVVHNKTVYLAGQVAGDDAGVGVYEETRSILANIDRLLAAAGSDKSRLLSATIWLTDMDSFADMNRAWEAWVVPGATPARATVMSPRLAAAKYHVEIGVVAAQS
jgi:enamine deaminase RidA (YjgF/YER057c/UK114 family)